MPFASALGLEAKVIKVWHRREKKLFQEKVFSEDAMRLLYGSRLGLAFTDRVLSSLWINKIYGLYHDSLASHSKVLSFIEELQIDLSECGHDLADYRSFNDFFARTLKDGARPIDPSPSALIAPADGRALAFPRINGNTLGHVKWAEVRLFDLFGKNSSLAKRYEDGACFIVRLAPADYHRYHFPFAGIAGPPQPVAGRLHSVSPYALEQGIPVYCLNKRSFCEIEVAQNSRILMMEVGALLVGSIQASYHAGQVEKGEEKGFFKFGGSTVILFFQKGSVAFDPDIVEQSAQSIESFVRMGEKIGTMILPSGSKD